MSFEIADSRLPVSRKFELIKDSLLQHDDLPLADVIDCNHWQSVFDQHGIDFGADDDCVYTPAITLWALILKLSSKLKCAAVKQPSHVSPRYGQHSVEEFAVPTRVPIAVHEQKSHGKPCGTSLVTSLLLQNHCLMIRLLKKVHL